MFEADITACFDEIDHSALMDRVRRRIGDKRVLALVKAFLKAGVLSEDGVERDTITGTPQGGILSPLLANIALSALDEHFADQVGSARPGVDARQASPRRGTGHATRPLRGRLCATNTRRVRCRRSNSTSGAVPEMEVGPPGSPCRGRSQTTASCVGQEPGW